MSPPSFLLLAASALTFASFSFSLTPAVAAEPALPDTSDTTRGLDLATISLAPLYEADFTKPLRYVKEADLSADGKRVRLPIDVDWVLEGQAEAKTQDGKLHLTNKGSHLVFWSTRKFPSDILLEFGVSPADSNKGLNIVFFAATGREGGSIFDLPQPLREGVFKNYHSGGVNCYHVSYWATDPDGAARGTAHIRKNHGFHLVSQGRDFINGQGSGPHLVRMLKQGGQIQVEVNGKLSVRWTDDGKAFGPALGSGLIGLRQMVHTGQSSYTHFKVWGLQPKPAR